MDPTLASITGVIMQAELLPDQCRAMLRDMLPHSLCIPSDKRHEAQSWAVSQIEQIFNAQKAALQASLAAEEAKLANFRSAEVGRLNVAKEAAHALEVQTNVVGNVLQSLEAATDARDSAWKAALMAQTENCAGESKLASAVGDKATLETVFEAHFKVPMQDGKGPHFKDLQFFLKQIEVDTALLQALPKTCAKDKEDRGSFDEAVLTELEKAISAKIKSLGETVAVETPASSARKIALQATERDHEEKQASQKQAEETHAAAKKAEADCQAALDQATEADAAYQLELETISASLEDATAALTAFEEGPLKGFTTYKNRVETPPEMAPGGA